MKIRTALLALAATATLATSALAPTQASAWGFRGGFGFHPGFRVGCCWRGGFHPGFAHWGYRGWGDRGGGHAPGSAPGSRTGGGSRSELPDQAVSAERRGRVRRCVHPGAGDRRPGRRPAARRPARLLRRKRTAGHGVRLARGPGSRLLLCRGLILCKNLKLGNDCDCRCKTHTHTHTHTTHMHTHSCAATAIRQYRAARA